MLFQPLSLFKPLHLSLMLLEELAERIHSLCLWWMCSLLLHGFWDLISICSCAELCIGQLQIPCGVQSTDATANGVVSPTGSITYLAALASEWIPNRKSTSHCAMTTLHLGRDDRGKENAVSPPFCMVSRFELEIGTSLLVWFA